MSKELVIKAFFSFIFGLVADAALISGPRGSSHTTFRGAIGQQNSNIQVSYPFRIINNQHGPNKWRIKNEYALFSVKSFFNKLFISGEEEETQEKDTENGTSGSSYCNSGMCSGLLAWSYIFILFLKFSLN